MPMKAAAGREADETQAPRPGSGDWCDLPLFEGPHVPHIRFERALDRLDFVGALPDAPVQWRDGLEELAAALAEAGSPARVDLGRAVACRRAGWPEVIELAWQRLVGRRLDAHGIPGTLAEEPAAAFLLRGQEPERAYESVRRHLRHHPRDARAWEVLAHFEPLRGAVRCAFHGGAVLDAAGHLIDAVMEDEVGMVGPWLLAYAWFDQAIALDEVAAAIEAEGLAGRPPLPTPRDGRAFAWYLVDAGGRSLLGTDSLGVVEARRRLQVVSPPAFRRYLRRLGGGRL